MTDQYQGGDEAQSGPPFVGTSPPEGIQDEKPSLTRAIERAAEAAGRAGFGDPLELTIEITAETHNQWIKTMKATLDRGRGGS
jgi:hypothetical protein